MRQLNRIIKINYEYPLAFYFLGLCYKEMDMNDKVKCAMERALLHTERLAKKDARYETSLAGGE